MFASAGVVRDAAGLLELAPEIHQAASAATSAADTDAETLRNLATVATSLAAAAYERKETRGAHARKDAPDRDDERFRVRLIVTDDNGLIAGA